MSFEEEEIEIFYRETIRSRSELDSLDGKFHGISE